MFNYLVVRFKKKEIVYGGWTILSVLGFFVFQLVDDNSPKFITSTIDFLIQPFPFIPEVSEHSSYEYFTKGYFLYQFILFLFSLLVVIKFGPLFHPPKWTKAAARKDILIGLFFVVCCLLVFPLFDYMGVEHLERKRSTQLSVLMIYTVHSKVWMSIFYFGYFWTLHTFLLITGKNIYKLKQEQS